VQVQTSFNGYYEALVEALDDYFVYVDAVGDRFTPDGFTYRKYVPAARKVVRNGHLDIQEDFSLELGGHIIMKAYDPNGTLLREGTFRNIHNSWLITTYLNRTPSNTFYCPVGDDFSLELEYDLTIPAFAIPLNSRQAIVVQWEVKGFGRIILKADGGGEGYAVKYPGDHNLINLNYELAKTKFRTINQTYYSCIAEDYSFSSSIKPLIDTAESYLNFAKSSFNDVEKASHADKALNCSLWAGERLELEKAKQDIEKYRKQDVILRIVDGQDNPLSNSTVMYSQTSHDFLYGFQSYKPSYMETATILKDAGFNLAVVAFDWNLIEPTKGKYVWRFVENQQSFDVLIQLGYKIKASPIFYLDSSQFPDWATQLSLNELEEAVLHFTSNITTRYHEIIDIYEVSIEANCYSEETGPVNVSLVQYVEILKSVVQLIRNIDPKAELNVNVLEDLGREVYAEVENMSKWAMGPHEFLLFLDQQNVDYDIVHIQHRPGYYHEEVGLTDIIFDLAELSSMLDCYGDLGKKIQLGELEIPSVHLDDMSNWWHRKWDDDLQAEYGKNFYTIAFSKPYVKSIVWYSVLRSCISEDPDPQESDLFDPDHNPKPVLLVLKELITKNWTTTGQATTNEDGIITFRGFAGNYNISIPEKEYTTTIHVTEGGNNNFTVTLRYLTDLNDDGTINIVDISIVASAYGTREGDERYNPIADLDGNRQINIVDISIVALDYGKTV